MDYNDKIEKVVDDVVDFINTLPEEERLHAAFWICSEIAVEMSATHMEAVGFADLLKDDIKDCWKFVNEEEKKSEGDLEEA